MTGRSPQAARRLQSLAGEPLFQTDPRATEHHVQLPLGYGVFHGDALRAEVGIGEVAARVGRDPGHQGTVHGRSDLPVPLVVRRRCQEGPYELGGGVREGGGSMVMACEAPCPDQP